MARWFGRGAGLALGLLATMVGLGALVLALRPPEIMHVGAAYAAKIVCSNVALAGRDPDEVMRLDVQAPGNPLLRLIDVEVGADGTTDVSFPFGVASQRAVPRDGVGCASVGESARATALARVAPASPIEPSALPLAIDPDVQALLERDDLAGPQLRAVLVLHDGRVVGERYGPGFDADTPLLGWSLTKTVTAALVGTAVKRGSLSLDDSALLPEWTDQRSAIRLRDLLAMEPGLEWNEGYGTVSDVTRMLFLERDAGRFAAQRPLETEPGTVFRYSTGTTVLLSRVLRGAIGEGAATYPTDALFAPLGMARTVFETDAAGTYGGGSLLYATARDWARFARFLLEDGRAPDGTALVPEGYVDWMMLPTAASNGRYGHGQIWRRGPTDYGTPEDASADRGLPNDTVWMLGHDGQSIAIVPSRGLALVRLGLTPNRLGYRPQYLLREVIDVLGGDEAAKPTT